MKIIKPTKVTDSVLYTSTVPENDYAEWNSGTAYVVGNRCILAATHKIYECLVNNTNALPSANLTGTTPKWMDYSATNRWKAFDEKIADQVSQANSIGYQFVPGLADSIAILNMEASSVVVTVSHEPQGVVYNKTYDLVATSNVNDFWTYCFEPIIRKTDLAITDLPPYSTAAVISVTIANNGGTAKVGEIVMGRQSYIGGTEQGCSISITDYSKKEADTFGNYVVVPRSFSRKLSVSLFMDNGLVDEVYRLLGVYRATPLVWIAGEDLSLLVAYGYYKSFDIVIPYPNNSTCSLEIEGLT